MAKKSGAAVAVAVGALGLAGIGFAVARKKKAGAAPAPAPGTATTQATVLTQYPVPSVPQVPPYSGPSAAPSGAQDVQSRVTAAIQSGDPKKMRELSAQLRQEGQTMAADSLDTYATGQELAAAAVQAARAQTEQILRGGQAAPQPTQTTPTVYPAPYQTPSPLPSGPAPTTPPTAPPAAPPFQLPTVEQVVQAAQTVLTGAQTPMPAPTASPWPGANDPVKYGVAKRTADAIRPRKPYTESAADKQLVKQFQAQEGLKADALYGPATGSRIATQYGIVPPKPLYWSNTPATKAQQRAEWTKTMVGLAARDPSRAAEWSATASV